MKMTKREATIFKRHSEANAAILECACPKCKAYKDWFTYRRWKAQKEQVNRGQVGTRLTVFLEKENGDIESKEGNKYQRVTAVVFCRHQLIN